jgi:hypothetical protein
VRSFTSGGAYRTRVLRQSSRFPDRSHDDEAINAAVEGDEVVIAAGMYAEDLYIDQQITLTRANLERVSERVGVKALIIGRVVVAASAINVTLDGIAVEAISTWTASSAPRRRSPCATPASRAGTRQPVSTPKARKASCLPSSPDPDPSGYSRRSRRKCGCAVFLARGRFRS